MAEIAISPAVTTQLPSDKDEAQLTAEWEDCRKEEHAAADELLHHSLLYPAYVMLRDILRAIRAKCSEKYLALTTYRKKKLQEANSADRKVF